MPIPLQEASSAKPSLSTLPLQLARKYSGLIFVWGILAACFVIVSPWTHVHSLNDSFAYINVTQRFATTGIVRLEDQMTTSFVAQAFWGAFFLKIFGNSIAVLSFSTVVAAIAATAGAYTLMRVISGSQAKAIVAGLCVAINPLFFVLSYGFMTDVPFLALTLWACVCFATALTSPLENHTHKQKIMLLFLGGLLATLAYLVRQVGLIIPICALGTLWVGRRLGWREICAVVIAPVAGYIGYTFWYIGIGGGPTWADRELGLGALLRWYQDNGFLSLVIILFRVLDTLQYMALFLAPIGLLRLAARLHTQHRNRRKRPPLRLAIWAVVILVYGLQEVLRNRPLPFLPNILTPAGFGPGLDDAWPATLTWPTPLWWLISIIALPASFWLGCELAKLINTCRVIVVNRLRATAPEPEQSPAWLFLVLCAGLTAIPTLLYTIYFDRYALPVIPFLIVLLLAPLAFQRHQYKLAYALAGISIAAFAFFNIVSMLTYRAWNDVRWAAGQRLLDQGVPAAMIEGGFDWDSWYSAQEWSERARAAHLPFLSRPWLYARAKIDDPPEYALSWESIDGFQIVEKVPFTLPFGGESILYVLKSEAYPSTP